MFSNLNVKNKYREETIHLHKMVKSFSSSDKLKRHINSGVCNGSTDCKDNPVMNTEDTRGF